MVISITAQKNGYYMGCKVIQIDSLNNVVEARSEVMCRSLKAHITKN